LKAIDFPAAGEKHIAASSSRIVHAGKLASAPALKKHLESPSAPGRFVTSWCSDLAREA